MTAVVGMAGILPGAPDLDAFWENVRGARVAPLVSLEAVWGIPRARYYAPPPGGPDRTYVDSAFLLPALEGAEGEDRQVAYGARVVAGALAAAGLDGRKVGLVAATSWTGPGYFEQDARRGLAGRGIALPPGSGAPAFDPGAQLEAIALRAGVGGARIAVDTACASSLYGMEVARGLLEEDDVEAVVVLGLNALLPPFLFVGFSKLGALARDGRILPFSAEASGILCGEGAGAVVVQKLERARSDGRRILGRIRALGLSSDGADRSVFAPGPDGQRLAYERAYAHADVASIDYLEAHGTATMVGDETELGCLDAFFRARDRTQPLPLGSVKALVGHTLACAGMVSLLKGLLMLRAGEIAPHVPVPPHPRLADSLLRLPTEPLPWRAGERPRAMGISSMGFGGANAHLVLEGPEGCEGAPRARRRRVKAAAGGAGGELAVVDAEFLLGEDAQEARAQLARSLGSAPERLGRVLPPRAVLEATGLRMGPNFLRRLDPLQLLVIEQARRILGRNPVGAEGARTGVVLVSNLGGGTALRMGRRFHYHLAHPHPSVEVERSLGPELTAESIATCLPALSSGYPAFHFDLRGFHLNLAGEPGALFTALRLAPYLLRDHCHTLLLGFARLLQSPLEIADSGRARQSEGVGLLLLRSLEAAREAGHPIRAVLRVREGSGLGPAKSCPATAVLLDEGSASFGPIEGIAELAQALEGSDAPASVVLEAQREGRSAVSLAIQREAGRPTAETVPVPPRLPLDIDLRPFPLEAESAPTAERVAPARAGRAALVEAWVDADVRAVRAFFGAQRAALVLLEERAQKTPLSGPVRAEPINVVVADACRAHDRVLSRLVVREDHPFYFDHPLDHVPGILLLEGVLQTVEVALGSPPPGEVFWVRRLEVRFKRFCEKGSPTHIELRPARADRTWEATVAQEGQVACSATIEVACASEAAASAGGPASVLPIDAPDRALLHKQNAENVLVGQLEPQAGGAYLCRLREAPPRHALSEGGRFYSPLYLLEALRGAVMLGAHTLSGIATDRPMILLSFESRMRGPVRRGRALALRCAPQAARPLGRTLVANIDAVVLADGEEVGVSEVKAQVLDEESYSAVRWGRFA